MMNPGNWGDWINIGGLAPGLTTFGDEILALYTGAQVLQSSVGNLMNLVCDGGAFS